MCRCERDSLGRFCPHALCYRCQTVVRSALPRGTLTSKLCNRLLHNCGSCSTWRGTKLGGFQRAQAANRLILLMLHRPEALRRLVTSAHADTEAGRVLNISEAAELLEVTRVTIYAWIEAKRLLA
jgi:hypothetical protein